MSAQLQARTALPIPPRETDRQADAIGKKYGSSRRMAGHMDNMPGKGGFILPCVHTLAHIAERLRSLKHMECGSPVAACLLRLLRPCRTPQGTDVYGKGKETARNGQETRSERAMYMHKADKAYAKNPSQEENTHMSLTYNILATHIFTITKTSLVAAKMHCGKRAQAAFLTKMHTFSHLKIWNPSRKPLILHTHFYYLFFSQQQTHKGSQP